MTKKILALALAGTTAFSVFASAMSVNAAATVYDDAYQAYVPVTLTNDGSAFTNAGTVQNFAGMFNFDGADQTIEPSNDSVVYAFDYARKADTDDANLKSLKSKMADATAVSTTETKTTLYTAFNLAYDASSFETALTVGTGASTARANAIYDLNKIYNDNIKKYTTADSTDNTDITVDELSEVYDRLDVEGYKLVDLFIAIRDAAVTTWGGAGNTGTRTSSALYLVQEYKRIVGDGLLNGADTTSVIDQYDELYAQLQERSEDDYTAANWKKFRRALEDAEDLAAEAAEAGTIAKWQKALDQLEAADAVEAIAGKYTDLQNALLALYTDGKLTSLNGQSRYDIDGAKSVYLASDYQETNMYGRRDVTAAYAAAFIDTIKTTSPTTTYYDDSAYTKAYKVWSEARKYGAKVAQSKIDNALAELEAAIDALDPTSSAPNYQMVLLETAVENVSGYQESDYNTSSRKYKDFTAALEKAEAVLAKANPSASEVLTAFTKLSETASDLTSVTKSVSAALQKDLREAINNATVSLKEMSSKDGAQYVALQEALAIARDVQANNWNGDNIVYNTTTYAFKSKSAISDYETAIANLDTAINGFNQVQGWYEEAGAWKYGEGNSVLNNGWNKIGNFWFFFNEDGTAKQNIWMNEGGKWYYFGNSCVAYSGWGMVDGSWYYFGKDCVMATGWIRPSHSYYYMDPASGKMVTGWAQIGGKWYYFSQASNNLGAMLTSTTTPDGYQVGADGAMI